MQITRCRVILFLNFSLWSVFCAFFHRCCSASVVKMVRRDPCQKPGPPWATSEPSRVVQASGMGGTVLTSPLPHHGPARFVHRTGLPPRRGDPSCSFLRRMPTSPSLPGPGREPRSQDAADRPHNTVSKDVFHKLEAWEACFRTGQWLGRPRTTMNSRSGVVVCLDWPSKV